VWTACVWLRIRIRENSCKAYFGFVQYTEYLDIVIVVIIIITPHHHHNHHYIFKVLAFTAMLVLIQSSISPLQNS
jgi:hypothetical protein